MDLIVEIGNSHDGSLGIAMGLVDMAANTGAKTVKFQMHLYEYESSEDEPFRVDFSVQDESRRDYWQRVNFSPEEWIKLHAYVINKNLEFLCTPFSIEAAQFLESQSLVRRWKVGSGDATNFPLIDFLAKTNKPLLISTGLASFSEIELLVARLEKLDAISRTTLLHCVSMYPTPLDKSGLNLIEDLRGLGCRVGLSDHSGKISTSLKGISMGIDTLEVHLTPHRLFFGPDSSSSLLPDEIRQVYDICSDWEFIEKNQSSKEELFRLVGNSRKIFRKGVYWKRDLKAGTIIEQDDLLFLKPVSNIDAIDFEKLIGAKLLSPVTAKSPVDSLSVSTEHEES